MSRLPPEPRRRRILYGRRKGRRLRTGQQQLLDRELPAVEYRLPAEGDPVGPEAQFDFAPSAIWLEVGFGAGEHLLEQAATRTDIGFIGCEPYVDGTVKLLGGIRDRGLRNVRIFRDDARLLLERLPDACLGRVFALFPDPWPKTRHRKRRFVSPPTLDLLSRTMGDGAELRLATDDSGYVAWILQHLTRHDGFEWLARIPADWRQRPSDWPPTRYERKALVAGRRCAYLRFLRVPRGKSDAD